MPDSRYSPLLQTLELIDVFIHICWRPLLVALFGVAFFLGGVTQPAAAVTTGTQSHSQGVWGSVYSQNSVVLAEETIEYHKLNRTSDLGIIVRSESSWKATVKTALPKIKAAGITSHAIVLPPTEAPTRKRCQSTKYFGGNYGQLIHRLGTTSGVGDVIVDDFMANVRPYSRKGCKGFTTTQFNSWNTDLAKHDSRVMAVVYPRDVSKKSTLRAIDTKDNAVILAYNKLRSTDVGAPVRQLHYSSGKRVP